MIVSDLHFEKGSAFARRGVLLPPYDTRETLMRLESVVKKYAPERVIVLGDSLHDREGFERIDFEDLMRIYELQSKRDWIWLKGNHDPSIPDQLGGTALDQFESDGLTFRHEPVCGAGDYEIAGHLHPVAKISRKGRSLRRRCFIHNENSLVVPAFGSYTGGLNILEDAFQDYFDGRLPAIWMLGEGDVFQVPVNHLIGD